MAGVTQKSIKIINNIAKPERRGKEMEELLNTIWTMGSAKLMGVAIQLLLMFCVAIVIVFIIVLIFLKYRVAQR